MPWAVAGSETSHNANRTPRHDAPAVMDETVREWLARNSWFTTDDVMRQAAMRIYWDLLVSSPHLPYSESLGRVITLLRREFPRRLPDMGFLVDAFGRAVGAAPFETFEQLAEARPWRVVVGAGVFAPSGAAPACFWFLPQQPLLLLPAHLAADLAQYVDSGGYVCVLASESAALEVACSAIFRVSRAAAGVEAN